MGLFIVLASVLTARAADLDSVSREDTVSYGGQFEPGMKAFLPPGGGAGQSGGGSTHRFAVGAKVSVLLGIGIEGAVRVTQKSNIRGGVNFFTYDFDQNKDGLDYNLEMRLRSVDVLYDWFPFGGGFHLSPGVMLYNDNEISASVKGGAGSQFTLGNTSYISNPANPIAGNATIPLDNHKVAPMLLLGWGNLIPRSGRHFGVNFEIGAVFIGSPTSTLSLTGSACSGPNFTNCQNAATDPTIQANIQSQRKKIDDAISFLQALPVISIGFGYSF